jgi:hypothetical protein
MAFHKETKQIPLSQGAVATVDAEDFEYLNQWKWHFQKKSGYAIRTQYLGVVDGKGVKKKILMHRVIMNTPDGMDTDHINGNGLDNRRGNLRVCAHRENMKNMRAHKDALSKYKGVGWRKNRSRWQATIMTDGRLKYIGAFETEIQAAEAYNAAALKYHGQFAKLNIVEGVSYAV